MLLRSDDDLLELLVTYQGVAGSQDAGDTRFAVRLQVVRPETRFTAETYCWVGFRQLATFAEQLRQLDLHRQGQAVLESMSPEELRLEIRSTSRAGHMAAFGQVGRHIYDGRGNALWTAVNFAIPFDPTELPGLVREFAALATVPC